MLLIPQMIPHSERLQAKEEALRLVMHAAMSAVGPLAAADLALVASGAAQALYAAFGQDVDSDFIEQQGTEASVIFLASPTPSPGAARGKHAV